MVLAMKKGFLIRSAVDNDNNNHDERSRRVTKTTKTVVANNSTIITKATISPTIITPPSPPTTTTNTIGVMKNDDVTSSNRKQLTTTVKKSKITSQPLTSSKSIVSESESESTTIAKTKTTGAATKGDTSNNNNNNNKTTASSNTDNNNNNNNNNSEVEYNAKIIFLQLDPTIRILLKSIQEYHSYVVTTKKTTNTTIITKQSSSTIQKQHNHDEIMIKLMIQSLRTIYKVLCTLHEIIEKNQYDQNYYNNSDQQQSTSIIDDQMISSSYILLFDYITLPLLALLRMPNEYNNTVDNDDDSSSTNQNVIQQCFIHKCIRLSSEILMILFQRIYYKKQINHCKSSSFVDEVMDEGKTYDNNNNNISNIVVDKEKDDNKIETTSKTSLSSLLISSKIIHKCLTACATALPNGQDVMMIMKNQNNVSSSHQTTIQSILQTIYTIIEVHQNTSYNIIQSLDGALLIRIIDTAVAIMEPPTSSTSYSTTIWDMTTITTHDIKLRSSLYIITVQTILSLLQMSTQITNTDNNNTDNIDTGIRIWRQIFPGIYTCIYRRIIQSIRYININTKQGNDIIQLCIKLLCQLLSICLYNIQHHDTIDTMNGAHMIIDHADTNTSKKTMAISEALQRIEQQSTSSTNTELKDPSMKLSSSSSGEDEIFLQQILQRIPSTLIILIQTLTSSKQILIREMAIKLNYVILIDTGYCWSSSFQQQKEKQQEQPQNNTNDHVDDDDDANNNNNDDDKDRQNNDLMTDAIESCLQLMCDDNDRISYSAKQCIIQYTTSSFHSIMKSSASYYNHHCRLYHIPRIYSLIESISSSIITKQRQQMRKSHHHNSDIQLSLQSTMKLIMGYLQMIMMDIPIVSTESTRSDDTIKNSKGNSSRQHNDNKKSFQSLQASLCTEDGFSMLQKTFTLLFDIDWNDNHSTNDNVDYENHHHRNHNRHPLILLLSSSSSSMSSSRMKYENQNTMGISNNNTSSSSSLLSFKYLTNETYQTVVSMVRMIGQVLGPKHSSRLIDQMVANIVQTIQVRCKNNRINSNITSSSSSKTSNTILLGHGQNAWLHEHIGALAFIKEVMLGAFSNTDIITAATMKKNHNSSISSSIIDNNPVTEEEEEQNRQDDKKEEKDKKRRKRWLVAIAKSILPVLVSYPLWNLPTDNIIDSTEEKQRSDDPSAVAVSSAMSSSLSSIIAVVDTTTASNVPKMESRRSGDIALSSTLRGNTYFICQLLELIGHIFQLLHSNNTSSDYVTIVLYYIVEKTSSYYSSSIHEHAMNALNQLIMSCQYSTISELLCHEMGSICSILLKKLRIPGGRSIIVTNDVTDVTLSALDTTTSLFRLLMMSSDSSLNKISDEKATRQDLYSTRLMSYIISLTDEFITRYDYACYGMKHNERRIITFLGLFDMTLLHLLASCRYYQENSTTARREDAKGMKIPPWFELLESFRKEEGEYDLRGRDKFAQYHKDQHQRPPNSTHNIDEDDITVSVSVSDLTRDTTFVTKIASRCCYLLSHDESLRVQVITCDVLIKCFEYLAKVTILCNSFQVEEVNGPKTAILRLVHSCWPAISARLKAMTSILVPSSSSSILLTVTHERHHQRKLDIVTNNNAMSSGSVLTNRKPAVLLHEMVNRNNNDTRSGEQRIYLSKLYNLVAAITESSDDFIASRFRQIVWPCIGQLLGHYIRHKQHQHQEQSKLRFGPSSNRIVHSHMSSSDKNLIQSVLNCLGRIYRHKPSGEALSGLIPSIGVVIFSLIDDDNRHNNETMEISSLAIETIQDMLRIDCDSLYRFLLEKSGTEHIPRLPFGISNNLVQNSLQEQHHTSNKPMLSSSPSHVTTTVARELLKFIDSLPEQEIP